jgi:hypothetical protein
MKKKNSQSNRMLTTVVEKERVVVENKKIDSIEKLFKKYLKKLNFLSQQQQQQRTKRKK